MWIYCVCPQKEQDPWRFARDVPEARKPSLDSCKGQGPRLPSCWPHVCRVGAPWASRLRPLAVSSPLHGSGPCRIPSRFFSPWAHSKTSLCSGQFWGGLREKVQGLCRIQETSASSSSPYLLKLLLPFVYHAPNLPHHYMSTVHILILPFERQMPVQELVAPGRLFHWLLCLGEPSGSKMGARSAAALPDHPAGGGSGFLGGRVMI